MSLDNQKTFSEHDREFRNKYGNMMFNEVQGLNINIIKTLLDGGTSKRTGFFSKKGVHPHFRWNKRIDAISRIAEKKLNGIEAMYVDSLLKSVEQKQNKIRTSKRRNQLDFSSTYNSLKTSFGRGAVEEESILPTKGKVFETALRGLGYAAGGLVGVGVGLTTINSMSPKVMAAEVRHVDNTQTKKLVKKQWTFEELFSKDKVANEKKQVPKKLKSVQKEKKVSKEKRTRMNIRTDLKFEPAHYDVKITYNNGKTENRFNLLPETVLEITPNMYSLEFYDTKDALVKEKGEWVRKRTSKSKETFRDYRNIRRRKKPRFAEHQVDGVFSNIPFPEFIDDLLKVPGTNHVATFGKGRDAKGLPNNNIIYVQSNPFLAENGYVYVHIGPERGNSWLFNSGYKLVKKVLGKKNPSKDDVKGLFRILTGYNNATQDFKGPCSTSRDGKGFFVGAEYISKLIKAYAIGNFASSSSGNDADSQKISLPNGKAGTIIKLGKRTSLYTGAEVEARQFSENAKETLEITKRELSTDVKNNYFHALARLGLSNDFTEKINFGGGILAGYAKTNRKVTDNISPSSGQVSGDSSYLAYGAEGFLNINDLNKGFFLSLDGKLLKTDFIGETMPDMLMEKTLKNKVSVKLRAGYNVNKKLKLFAEFNYDNNKFIMPIESTKQFNEVVKQIKVGLSYNF